MKKLRIHTDGWHDIVNTNAGGWAYVGSYDDTNEQDDIVLKYGGIVGTTNNRMELTAVLQAMCWFHSQLGHKDVVIISDSKYVVDGINKGWVKNWIAKHDTSRPNYDLWLAFIEVYDKIECDPDRNIELEWVKGHAGDKFNEIADKYAGIGGREAYGKFKKSEYAENVETGLLPSDEQLGYMMDRTLKDRNDQFPCIMVHIKCFYDVEVKMASIALVKDSEIVHEHAITNGRLYLPKSAIIDGTKITDFIKKVVKNHKSNTESSLMRAQKIMEKFSEVVEY